MPLKKNIYIHFETQPSYSRLAKFFSKFPDYTKVFATSYHFCTSEMAQVQIRDWAEECFPNERFVVCIGSFSVREELLGKLIYQMSLDERD